MNRLLSPHRLSQLAILPCFLVGAAIAEGQLVQVAPGYVKAPFVRVYRTPYGTSVRAPFTRVDGGAPVYGHYYPQRTYGQPYEEPQVDNYEKVETSVDEVAELSLLERQRRLLAKSARQLERDLARFRGGNHWQSILELPPEFVNGDMVESGGAEVQADPAAVKSALENYEMVASGAQSRKIALLRSFRTTHRLLREYVSLLSLPSETPEAVEPELASEPEIEIPFPTEQSAEELPLPQLAFPR